MADKTINSRQRKAITYLLTTKDVRAAARQSGISERSMFRYMADPSFQVALAAAEGDAIDQAVRRLIVLQEKAVDTLDQVLEDREVKVDTRLRAAQTVLDQLMKFRELRDLERRLAKLEELANINSE